MPLVDTLSAFGFGRISATSSGNQIVSTSAGGKSVTFAAPSADFSQVDLAETASRILDLYDSVAANGGDDATIYEGMMNRLRAVRNVSTTFGGVFP